MLLEVLVAEVLAIVRSKWRAIPPLLQAYPILDGIVLKFHLISVNTCMDLQSMVATYTLNATRY